MKKKKQSRQDSNILVGADKSVTLTDLNQSMFLQMPFGSRAMVALSNKTHNPGRLNRSLTGTFETHGFVSQIYEASSTTLFSRAAIMLRSKTHRLICPIFRAAVAMILKLNHLISSPLSKSLGCLFLRSISIVFSLTSISICAYCAYLT